jgi:hypothetical protein
VADAERKLAAILSADGVGYSRLTAYTPLPTRTFSPTDLTGHLLSLPLPWNHRAYQRPGNRRYGTHPAYSR